MLYTLLFFLVVAYICWYYYQNFYLFQKRSKIPGPSVWGSLVELKPTEEEKTVIYLAKHNLYKDFFSFWLGPMFMVMALDPESAKFVLKDPRFKKTEIFRMPTKHKDYFGENLVSLDGDDWRRVRNIVNYGFTNQSLSTYYPTFVELTEKALTMIPLEGELELTNFFSRFTLDVLGKTIFNHDFRRLEGLNDKYYKAYKTFFDVFTSVWGRLMMLAPNLIALVPVKPIVDYLNGLDELKALFEEMIKEHKGKADDSILSKLLSASENPEMISDRELMANIWVFFVAGHETTSNALTWALNCLQIYPDIQDKLYDEVKRVVGTDKIPTENDLENLVYLDAFVQEVLRLHSPVPSLATRKATEEVIYKDMVIPKGSLVGIHFHALHTNPEHWDDPMKFNPDRFLPENRKGRNHFLYIPFSAGLRQCIGNIFSLIEQRLFLTRLLQKYRVVAPKVSKTFPEDRFLSAIQRNVPVSFEKRN